MLTPCFLSLQARGEAREALQCLVAYEGHRPACGQPDTIEKSMPTRKEAGFWNGPHPFSTGYCGIQASHTCCLLHALPPCRVTGLTLHILPSSFLSNLDLYEAQLIFCRDTVRDTKILLLAAVGTGSLRGGDGR